MIIVRARFEELGGHTHVRVFATMCGEASLGKAGDLVFRNEEWSAIRPALERIGWQVLPEVKA